MNHKYLSLIVIMFSLQAVALSGQSISLDQTRVQIPVLKYKSFTPVLQFKLETTQAAKDIWLEFAGTSETGDIGSVFLIGMREDSTWTVENGRVIAQASLSGEQAKLSFDTLQPFTSKYYIVAVKLRDGASLDHFVSVGIRKVVFSESTHFATADPSRLKQRIGVALRQGGDDGVIRYRIPGLACTNDGALLAIYDVRRDRHRDLQGNIDIGVNRSTDGGNTWEPMKIGLDMGEYGGLPQKYNGVSDACILVDKNSNNLFIAGCWMHGIVDGKTGHPVLGLTKDSTAWNHQWRNYGSLQGYAIEETSQFIITKSTDDGRTWEAPINITKQIKRPEWHLFAPAPGSGITLDDGTLIFPTQGKDKDQIPFSNITYSKDGGKTWQSSNPSYHNTTENMVVQLSDGSIMQNMRDNRNAKNKSGTNGRAIFTTEDLGENWEPHVTSHLALKEPVCMASLYKHTYVDLDGKNRTILLFSNPNSKYRRDRMTIKVSFDDGKTWPENHWLLLDELNLKGGYSSLTSVNNNTIGILYEGSQAQMTFERIKLAEFGITDAQSPK